MKLTQQQQSRILQGTTSFYNLIYCASPARSLRLRAYHGGSIACVAAGMSAMTFSLLVSDSGHSACQTTTSPQTRRHPLTLPLRQFRRNSIVTIDWRPITTKINPIIVHQLKAQSCKVISESCMFALMPDGLERVVSTHSHFTDDNEDRREGLYSLSERRVYADPV